MAEKNENGGAEKTEDPTPRKLEKAREDGKVVTSKEIYVLTSIIMMMVLLYLLPTYFYKMASTWSNMFRAIGDVPHGSSPILALNKSIYIVFSLGLIVGTPLLIVTIFTQYCMGGLVFSLKAISWKPEKLDPIEGLKKIFSIKGLVELGKGILKVVCLFGIGVFIMSKMMPNILQITKGSFESAVKASASFFPLLLISLILGLSIIAILDYWWQKHSFIKELKMNKQDLKDESKDTDGNPEVKAKIRRLQYETSQKANKQAASLDDVKDATAIFVNPTHYAVAVKYEIGNDSAPIVLAMGRGKIAEKIISSANDFKITVFRSPVLARALYFTSEIGQEISEKLYTAVAIALAYIYKIEQGENLDEPSIEIPDDLIYNEDGVRMNSNEK